MAGGIDTYTKLMLHCNGADESTTFTDDSNSAHTVTAHGTAQIDTAQSKFGGASGLFDGNSDYLTIPDSNDWNFGAGDFTIDFWVRFNVSQRTMFYTQNDLAGNTIYFYAEASPINTIRIYWRESSVTKADYKYSWSPSLDTWYHIEIGRSGTNLYLFVDGDLKTWSTIYTVMSNNAVPDISTEVYINRNAAGSTYYLDGWIDEYRISKGICRHTESFTPETEEYSSFYIEQLSQIFNITDSIALEQHYIENLDQTFNMTVTLQEFYTYLEELSQTFTHSNSISDIQTYIENLTQTFNLTTSIALVGSYIEDLDQTFNCTVSVDDKQTYLENLSQSFELTVSETDYQTYVEELLQTFSLSDSLTDIQTYVDNLNQTFNMTVSVEDVYTQLNTWRLYRNLQASLKYYLDTEIASDSLIDIEGNTVNVIVAKKNEDFSLPCISVRTTVDTLPIFRIGSTDRLDKQKIIVEIFAKNELDRMEIANWLTTKLQNGFRYYVYSPNPNTPDSPIKSEGAWVHTNFVQNGRVNLGQNVNQYDAHRHRITVDTFMTGS